MADKTPHQKPRMEELTWEQVRSDVLKVNPEFVKIVDKLNPSKEYTLFKARYPYGSEILRQGDLYIPNAEGELVSLKHSSISDHIRNLLNYNLDSNPVSMCLNKSVELFITLENHTIPLYSIARPGNLFGLWRVLSDNVTLQPKFIWSMTAGARSIFMLPKISEAERHKKLKKFFHLQEEVPRTLMDHWEIFRGIADHPDFSEPWSVETLFFSKKWLDHLRDDAWQGFNYFLYETAWKSSEFWRNQFFWNLIFSIVQQEKNLHPSFYIFDTVKYLLAIGVGELPGFAPAIDDSVAPVKGIQKAYIDIYNLKNYAPIIMQPYLFSLADKDSRPVYYSLQYPNATEFGPKSRSRSSIITDLYEIKSVFNKFLKALSSGKFNIQSTKYYDLLNSVNFDYFHNNVESYHDIKESREIPSGDCSFLQQFENYDNAGFPVISAFVTGCIRISHKK